MTTIFNSDLWGKISNFQIDEPNVYEPFSKRLAREQHWTPEFTAIAIHEYKKFMFLAVTSDFSVTPSLIIDEVWHEHLTFTKNYWIEFCQNTIGKDIHHTPSGGSDEEALKYHDAFLKTLEVYELAFGEKPPAEVWFRNPVVDRANEKNRENRRAGQWASFGIALLSGVMFSNFFPFICMMILGQIVSASAFPHEPTPFDNKDGSCSGGGCGGGSCGGGCGGCGGG